MLSCARQLLRVNVVKGLRDVQAVKYSAKGSLNPMKSSAMGLIMIVMARSTRDVLLDAFNLRLFWQMGKKRGQRAVA